MTPRRMGRMLCLMSVLTTVLLAQRPGPREIPAVAEGLITYDAIVLPTASADSFIVDIHYRIPASFFVFLRTAEGRALAEGELLVELNAAGGAQTRREVRPIRLERAREPQAGEEIADLQNVVRFVVAPATYTIVFELKEHNAERRFLERRRTLEVTGNSGLTAVPRPLFGYRSADGSSFIPFNRGGAALFGSRGGMVLHVRPNDSGPTVVEWRVANPDAEDDGRPIDLRAQDTIKLRKTLTDVEALHGLAYRFDSAAVGAWTSIYLPLPLERMAPGPYTVEITISEGSARFQRIVRFPVIWPGMPRSLANFELAVDALRHIADPEEIDDMIGFFAEGGRQRFDEFWRQHDTDTSDVYNPAQAEYYRRVDEAVRRYSTRDGGNGYKTDRGRILILFGTPTSSQRVFRPNTGPREVWIYESQKKRFIFTDPNRTGEYTLSQTEDL